MSTKLRYRDNSTRQKDEKKIRQEMGDVIRLVLNVRCAVGLNSIHKT